MLVGVRAFLVVQSDFSYDIEIHLIALRRTISVAMRR
jgi:hypothetical protein